jgi:two-component sensor histidine kinase
VQDELSSIDAVLDDLLNYRWNLSEVSLDRELQQVRRNWAGLIALTLDSDDVDGLTVDARTQENITNAVNEAITNAVRHGRAQHVDVSLAVDSGLITLTCTDDGEGPTEGSPGLGSTLFDSISQGVWELRAQAPHGSKLVMSIAPDGAPRT